MKFIFIVLVVLFCIVEAELPKEEHFKLYDPNYTPKTWKLVPRTVPLPATERQSVLGVSPDDYFSFIPTYTGSVLPGQIFKWTGECFQQNTATVISKNGSYVLSLNLTKKKSLFCTEGFLFAYIGEFSIKYFELPGEDDITFDGTTMTVDLVYDINNLGIRMFTFPTGFIMTGTEIYETILLFFGGLIGAHVPEWTAEDNLKFLQDHMNVTMPVRTITDVDIPLDQIKSGDFLGVIRLDGLDPMLAWAMGSHTGHTCITMWVNGSLYVMESTTVSEYWPTDGIQMTPWNTWIAQAKKANYNVVHLPLDPKIAAKFNVDNALAFFETVKGLPYGFHNLFTGWIDTPEDNYPVPLSSQLVQLLAPFADWLLQKELAVGVTYDFVTQSLNKRLNTVGLTIGEVYMTSGQRNISFTELVTLPEQDNWIFNDNNGVQGRSMVCDVFVTEMWKAGGIFGTIVNQIQATEFTNLDAYSLNIFDANYVRPAQCVAADPDSQFCQILGQYRMALPKYNTAKPFPHMREKCPGLAPLYIRPDNC